MRRNLGTLLLGLLAGGLIIHLHHVSRLDQLYWEKEKLKVQIFETTERLARIEKLWTEEQKGEISSVEFMFKGDMSPFAELELQRQAREITAGLIGSAIREVQPELLVSLLHRRKFTVEKKDYLVMVDWVIIAPAILFNLSVSPSPGGG